MGKPGAKSRRKRSFSRADSPKWHLTKLRPFMIGAGRGTLAEEERLAVCIKASLIKAYEFCAFAYGRLKDEIAFHCVGGLRSICEDLIILKFISTLPLDDQKTLLAADAAAAIHNGMRYQATFFDTFRLGQPVLRGAYPPEALARLDRQVDDIWRRHGWPRAREGKWPPTEQLARKVGQGTVDVIYDYIFRLTSSTVHFSTRALLRTGWGDLTSDGKGEVIFSIKNMSGYFVAFCQIYGVFLLSIYFEFFPEILGVTPAVQQRVQRMRTALITQNRWPEMLTFEEANKPIPKGQEVIGFLLQHVLSEEFRDGFIVGAEKAKIAAKTAIKRSRVTGQSSTNASRSTASQGSKRP
jgi:hypothetical protein